MKLIVGLGNIGEEYAKTRHNVGFLFLDYLVEILKIKGTFSEHEKLGALILKSPDYIFVKPITYMNDSGIAINKIKNYYRISINDLIVFHDDIDQSIGKFKFIANGGSGGHKGIDSLNKHLGTLEFKRVKIGVAPILYNPSIHKAEDFVLKNFKKEEFEILKHEFEKISESIIN
jgi:peptidyl-tRNA hydrolase, PTH1 family